MANFRQYTMDEIWRPPIKGGEEPAMTGCPLMDALTNELKSQKNSPVYLLAARLGITSDELSFSVRAMTGISCSEWVNRWAMRDARWLLINTELSIGQISRRVGYSRQTDFGRAFRKIEKMQPHRYREYNRR